MTTIAELKAYLDQFPGDADFKISALVYSEFDGMQVPEYLELELTMTEPQLILRDQGKTVILPIA